MLIALHGVPNCLSFILLYSIQMTFVAAETCTIESPSCVCSYEFLKADLKELILNSGKDELINRIRSYQCQQFRQVPTVLVAMKNRNPSVMKGHRSQQPSLSPKITTNNAGRSNMNKEIPLDGVEYSNQEGYYPEDQSISSRRQNGGNGRGYGNKPQPDYPYGPLPDYGGDRRNPNPYRNRPAANTPMRGGGPPGSGRGGGRHHPHFGMNNNPRNGPPVRSRGSGPRQGYFPSRALRKRRDVSHEYQAQQKKLLNAVPKLPSSSTGHLYAFLGHGIQIPCNDKASVFPLKSNFKWYHINGNPVSSPAASINEMTGELSIPATQLSDTDLYNCSASNQEGQAIGTYSHQLSIVTYAIHWLSVEAKYTGISCSPEQSQLVQKNVGPWINEYVCPVCTVHDNSVICDNSQGVSSYEIKFAMTAFNFETEVDRPIDSDACPELCVQALHLLLLNIMKDSLEKLFGVPMEVARSTLSPVPGSTVFELMTGCLAGFEYQYEICFPCLPGHYSIRGDSFCVECFEGQYQPSPGASACLPCDPGQATIDEGSTSLDQCLPASVVEAYHAAEKNSAAAVVFLVIFSILLFLLLLYLLICCCCPHTKTSEWLRKYLCLPCHSLKSMLTKSTKSEEVEIQAESKGARESKSEVRLKKEMGTSTKRGSRTSQIALARASFLKPQVKYSPLANETTTTEGSEVENEDKTPPPPPPSRKSVETQVKLMMKAKPKEVLPDTSPVKKRHSFPLTKTPSPNLVEKGTNVTEKRRSLLVEKGTNTTDKRRSLPKEKVPDDSDILLTSEDDTMHTHKPVHVKETVAKINAVSKMNKLYQDVRKHDKPKSPPEHSRGERIKSPPKSQRNRADGNRRESAPPYLSPLLNKPYAAPNEARKSGEKTKSEGLTVLDDNYGLDQRRTEKNQWENYCQTCVRPSYKKSNHRLPPPPPALPE